MDTPTAYRRLNETPRDAFQDTYLLLPDVPAQYVRPKVPPAVPNVQRETLRHPVQSDIGFDRIMTFDVPRVAFSSNIRLEWSLPVLPSGSHWVNRIGIALIRDISLHVNGVPLYTVDETTLYMASRTDKTDVDDPWFRLIGEYFSTALLNANGTTASKRYTPLDPVCFLSQCDLPYGFPVALLPSTQFTLVIRTRPLSEVVIGTLPAPGQPDLLDLHVLIDWTAVPDTTVGALRREDILATCVLYERLASERTQRVLSTLNVTEVQPGMRHITALLFGLVEVAAEVAQDRLSFGAWSDPTVPLITSLQVLSDNDRALTPERTIPDDEDVLRPFYTLDFGDAPLNTQGRRLRVRYEGGTMVLVNVLLLARTRLFIRIKKGSTGLEFMY